LYLYKKIKYKNLLQLQLFIFLTKLLL